MATTQRVRVVGDNLRSPRRGAGARFSIPALFLTITSIARPAIAQQTLYNLPTPDILPRGGVYGELDNTFKTTFPKTFEPVPRMVAGLGRELEVGVNVTGLTVPGKPLVGVEPVVKWGAAIGHFRFTLVNYAELSAPSAGRSGLVARHMVIAHFSRSSRFGQWVAGGYNATRGFLDRGDRAGVMAEYLKPLRSGLTFGAEWMSGNQALGLLSPGLTYSRGQQSFYLSYELGNHNGHRNGVEFEYGFRFR